MKDYIRDRLIIIKSSIIYTFQIETAYWANNWGNIISTVAFTISYILFVDIIFSNIKLLAGYTKDEVLFFTFVSQTWFYIMYSTYFSNIIDLVENVNGGDLDLMLTKPIPALFYISFKEINLFSGIRDGIAPFIAIIISINWASLHFETINIIYGIIIFILGLIADHSYQILLALPSFWLGESSNILNLGLNISDKAGHTFPFEGWDKTMRMVFTIAVPVAIVTGVSTSVMLGKSDKNLMLILSFIGTFLIVSIRSIYWRLAIRNYTSASS